MDVLGDYLDNYQASGLRCLPLTAKPSMDAYKMIHEDECNYSSLLAALENDPILAARVCGTANSIFYNKTSRDEWNVEKCLMRVGQEYAKQLVVVCGDINKEYFPSEAITEIAYHSINLKYFMAQWWDAASNRRIDVDLLKTAALTHDIGFMVSAFLWRNAKVVAMEPLKVGESPNDPYKHCKYGATLASSWSLPRVLCDVIQYHHEPTLCPEGVAREICHILRVGERYLSGMCDYNVDEMSIITQWDVNIAKLRECFVLKNM